MSRCVLVTADANQRRDQSKTGAVATSASSQFAAAWLGLPPPMSAPPLSGRLNPGHARSSVFELVVSLAVDAVCTVASGKMLEFTQTAQTSSVHANGAPSAVVAAASQPTRPARGLVVRRTASVVPWISAPPPIAFLPTGQLIPVNLTPGAPSVLVDVRTNW